MIQYMSTFSQCHHEPCDAFYIGSFENGKKKEMMSLHSLLHKSSLSTVRK